MKKITLLIVSVLFAFSCSTQKSGENYTVLNPNEYQQEISKNKVTIVDVRTPGEYQSGHIENAKNIDVNSKDFKSKFQGFDKKEPIYIYCRSGARSYQAGKILQELGFEEVYDLQGGVLNWSGELKK